MNGFHRFPRRLSAVLLVSLGAGAAQAQLNDTGQDTCYNGSLTLVLCDADTTGDNATDKRQDGRFGRDAAAAAGVLPKTGGGAAGFDFTPLDASGNPIPLTGTPPVPSATPVCIRDNHTNLIWEVKTDDGGFRDKDWTYTWYDGSTGNQGTTGTCGGTLGVNNCNTQNYIAAVNTPPGLCGYPSGWRLPTRRELLSIVHNGKDTDPTIDIKYFPNTFSYRYWSADPYAPDPAVAWCVNFGNGSTTVTCGDYGAVDGYVRLVHSGQ